MHAPDGLLEPSVALIMAILSAAVIGCAVRHTGRELGDRQVPLAGIAAAFVFAAQMFNFPVASGTSGHLLGGALAAVLLGPWVGALVVAVVIVVQALLFADGGLTALGYNVFNMAVVTAFGGWAAFALVRRVLPRNATGVAGAAAVAAGVSVPLSAATFALEWLFGAGAPVAFDDVFAAMVGVHSLIGVGEGVITGLVVAAVLATRPDLVAGAADLTAVQLAERPKAGVRPFAIGALLAVVFVAAAVSQFGSGAPDGLERVAAEQGFGDQARPHPLSRSLFADYATRGVDDASLSLAVAGVAGAALTLLVGYGLLSASRRAR
jgi:cobalt/nickel transport system permease protein